MSKVTYTRTTCIHANPDRGVSVYRGTSDPGATPVVIKELVSTNIQNANAAMEEALNQAKLYTSPAVVKVYACRIEQISACALKTMIIQEEMECDLMCEILTRSQANNPWSESEVLTIAFDIVTALWTAQYHSLSHRDIKPQNIFMKGGKAKIGDFGSSAVCDFESLKTTMQGTPLFLSPELKKKYIEFLGDPGVSLAYDPFKSDVYSLGVTFAYMFTLNSPSEIARIDNLEAATEQYIASLTVSEPTKHILRGMLAVEPTARLSFEDVYRLLQVHPIWHTQSIAESSVASSEISSIVQSLEEVKLAPAASPRKRVKETVICLSCRHSPPTTFAVTDPSLASSYKSIARFFCSQRCLSSFATVCNYETCQHCQTSLVGGECSNGKRNLKMKKNFVMLACGHLFHTKKCFQLFWTQRDERGEVITCPKCKQAINEELVAKVLGKNYQAKLQTLRSKVSS